MVIEMNEVLERLPPHLLQYAIEQPYNEYTSVDHAVWRYVMRQNVSYLSKVAHHSYLEGLRKTGISIETIPTMYGMNRILRDIGWASCNVDGFIPPAAFMEFQAYKVLVIAADIRTLDHIEYTPAPDIIHEAAGHAPIIANDEYSEYLQRIGYYGARAFASREDYSLFEAIRHLSIVKEDPNSNEEEVSEAEGALSRVSLSMGPPSEASRIRNLHWWSVEYGLIGTVGEPRIYGAGLLSSIGESYSCLQPHVKKLPFSVGAADQTFDITKPQPQLYVTRDFTHLREVLEQFVDGMAIRKGGRDAVDKAVSSGYVSTLVFPSGLQISGLVSRAEYRGEATTLIRISGKIGYALAERPLSVNGHIHEKGEIVLPVGPLRGNVKPLHTLTDGELTNMNCSSGKLVHLSYEGGIELRGELEGFLRAEDGTLLAFRLRQVRIFDSNGDLLFSSRDEYCLPIGERITSGFAGPIDRVLFPEEIVPPAEKTRKISYSPVQRQVHSLYSRVRDVREGRGIESDLRSVWKESRVYAPEDWLLTSEILEQSSKFPSLVDISLAAEKHLKELRQVRPELSKLIGDAFMLLEVRKK